MPRGFTLHDLPPTPRAAFDRGQDPVVSLVNIATVPLGIDLGKLAVVLQEYVNKHLGPVWDLPPVKVQARARAVTIWSSLRSRPIHRAPLVVRAAYNT